jgi:hypothetical protein
MPNSEPRPVSKPSPAWKMPSRMMDTLIGELSPNDLDDLYTRVQRERNKQFLESRRRPCPDCGFFLCQCFEE